MYNNVAEISHVIQQECAVSSSSTIQEYFLAVYRILAGPVKVKVVKEQFVHEIIGI